MVAVRLRCTGSVSGTAASVTIPPNFSGVCDTCGLLVRVSDGDAAHTIETFMDEVVAEVAVRAGLAEYPPEGP